MKTLAFYSTFVLFLFLISCNSESGNTTTTTTETPKTNIEKITTKWKLLVWMNNNNNQLPPGEATWTFNADKTFDLVVANGSVTQKGKWDADEKDYIRITIDDDPEFIVAKYSFENNKMIIEGEMGDESSYKVPYRAELETINK